MSTTQNILDRIAYLQAELGALAALVRVVAQTPATDTSITTDLSVLDAPQPVESVATPKRRTKAPAAFSYMPTASYRITGDNPFRNGNNLALFDHLVSVYADCPFTRAQLGEEIGRLQARGVMQSRQDEQAIVIGFLSFAGIDKGRIAMVPREVPAPVVRASAPERDFKVKRRQQTAQGT